MAMLDEVSNYQLLIKKYLALLLNLLIKYFCPNLTAPLKSPQILKLHIWKKALLSSILLPSPAILKRHFDRPTSMAFQI
jgi:hypothetical protein